MRAQIRFNKLTAWLLTLAMLMTLVPSFTLLASAAEENTAVITGVYFCVDGVAYTSGTVTLTPDSENIVLTVTGTNLNNGTTHNKIFYGKNSAGNYMYELLLVDENGWTFNADNTIATLDMNIGALCVNVSVWEILYTNDGESLHSSGVSVLYVENVTPDDSTYTVTVNTAENGTVTANKTTAAEGDEITLTIAPANGYELDTLTVDETNVTADVTDGEYTFTMPAKNVTVSATFKETPVIESLAFNSDSEAYDAATNTFYYDAEHPLKLTITGKNLLNQTLYIAFKNSDGISCAFRGIFPGTVVEVSKTILDNILDTFAQEGRTADIVEFWAALYDYGPDTIRSVPLNVVPGTHTIALPTVIGGTVEADKTTAAEGEEVTLTVTPADGKEVASVAVVDENGDPVDVTKNSDDTYTFAMPAGSVSVRVTFRAAEGADAENVIIGYAPDTKSPHNNTDGNAQVTNTTWTDGGTGLFFHWGEDVPLYAELWDDGSKLHSETVTAQAMEDDNYLQFSFTGDQTGTPTRVLASYGFDADLTADMPGEFTQSANLDPGSLSDHILLQGSGAYGEQVDFAHIPAYIRFRIYNWRREETTIKSVSLRIKEGGPVASSGVALTPSAESWTADFTGGHTEITTPLSNASITGDEQYFAYAMALPLDDANAFKGKTLQFVATIDGPSGPREFVTYELEGEMFESVSGSYDWKSGELYTFHLYLDCAGGCLEYEYDESTEQYRCIVCGIPCFHREYTGHDCNICKGRIPCEDTTGDNLCDIDDCGKGIYPDPDDLNVKAEAGGGQITVTWDALPNVGTDTVASYTVYYYPAAGDYDNRTKVVYETSGTVPFTHTFTGLTAGVTYAVGVTAVYTWQDVSDTEINASFEAEDCTEVTFYNLWVGGVQVTAENAADVLGDGTVSYNTETNTLTLNNANLTSGTKLSSISVASLLAKDELNIELKGTNRITAPDTTGGSTGIVVNSNLTIFGSGSLTVISGNVTDATEAVKTGYFASNGIATDGLLTIRTAEVNAVGGTVSVTGDTIIESSNGICQAYSNGILSEYGLALEDGAKLNVTSGSVSANTANIDAAGSYGIYVLYGDTIIYDAVLNVAGGKAIGGERAYSYGIESVFADIKICDADAKVTFSADDTEATEITGSNGICIYGGDLDIQAGSVSVTSGKRIEGTIGDNDAVYVEGYTDANNVLRGGNIILADGMKISSPVNGAVKQIDDTYYTIADGSGNIATNVKIEVRKKNYSGGSSSSSTTTTKNDDGSTTKITTNKSTGTTTETTTYPDGSTTKVETKKDGTVTTTEKDKDGNTTTTVENPDGSSTTTEKNKDGSEIVVEKDTEGTTTTTEKDSEGNKTVTTEKTDGTTTTEETKKDGTTVKTETNADGETTAEVEAKDETEVVIPVENAEDVYEVVVTDASGNKTVITDFETIDNGIAITVDGNASVSVSKGSKKEFVDVHPVDHWSEESVDYVYVRGLMMGTGENHFSPDTTLTRAMIVTVLYRLEGEPRVSGITSFADLEKGQYYLDAVCWAQVNGIVNGVTETEFAPNDNIPREQIAAIMHRYAQYKGYGVSVGENTNILSYDDFDSISEYAIASIQYAVGGGLMKGKTSSTLNPLDNATRAEVAAILERFIKANK